MQGRDVSILKIDGLQVVLLSFLEFAQFVPAEGSIIECFEVFLVKFNCFRVVFYGILVFSLFPKREPPIMIKVSIIRFEFYSFRK
jgi:hypothetical protein